MKYLVPVLALMLLVGTGCADTSSTQEDSNEPQSMGQTTQDNPEADDMEVQMELTTDDGEVITQTITETTDEDGVPVTEIVLGAPSEVAVTMEAGNFFFSPNTITATPGQAVSVTFSKNSGIHTFVIDEIGAKFSIAEGETFIFTAPSEPGEYAFYCDIGSHRSFGMEGTLIVK